MPTPRALVTAGALLLVVAVAGTLLARRGSPPAPSAPTAPPATTSPPATTAPPPAAFGIAGVAVAPRAYAATVTWQTSEPSTARVTWGPAGMTPYLWADAGAPAVTHTVTLAGLASATRYALTIDARTDGGDSARRRLELTTAPAPQNPVGSVGDGVLRVDGDPFFPILAWEECPDRWQPDLADGITLFAGDPCTGLASLLGGVAGRALAAGTTEDQADVRGPGLVGWFYADEADARGLTAAGLTPTYGVRFLTLTSHFWTGGAPLPTGRAFYPGLIAQADVVGFDLYPLQALCRPDLLPAVFDAQRELGVLAGARPTYQWIEIREMNCPQPEDAVTARTIEVETWLALAAGAHGLGFFPSDWQAPTDAILAPLTARIRQLQPALLQPPAPLRVTTRSPAVRAGARELGGAYYVVAVNAGRDAARVTLAAPALADRTLEVVGAHARVVAHEGAFSVTLPPLTVRVYVAPPA